MIYPLTVTHEDIEGFEEVTGFKGIGERMVRTGIWRIKEESCKKSTMAPSPSSVVKQRKRGAPVIGSQE